MNVKKRRIETINLLEKSGEVQVAELSALFGVSEMTVRRDLEALEKEQVLKRVKRGAVSATSSAYEPPYILRANESADIKARIGRVAAGLISEGETVIVDVGTTALAVAEALKGKRNITVLTPSLRVAWTLADQPDMRVIITGGIVRPMERSVIGSLSERAFGNFYCDAYFMGAGGVDAQGGLTEFNLDDARIKQEALKRSRRCIVVADTSKIGKIAFTHIAGIDDVDVLVTNASQGPQKKIEELRTAGLELIDASTERMVADQ